MNDNKKEHFWIPDGEIKRVNKTLTARTEPRNRDFFEHGKNLGTSLEKIKKTVEVSSNDNSLRDIDIIIFQVELPEKEKVQNKTELFDNNGLSIKAVKNERNAIVATTKGQFRSLEQRVSTYMSEGTNKTSFDYIECFKSYSGSDKDSSDIRKAIDSDKIPAELDVQLMLVPNLDSDMYKEAISKILQKIEQTNGKLNQKIYYLTDRTPIIPAIIPSNTLTRYENDPAIYQIEKTAFFSAEVSSKTTLNSDFRLDEKTNLESLPIVAVLDSGVHFTDNLNPVVIEHWCDPDSRGGDCEHGTKVAGCVAFKYIAQHSTENVLVPRARIIDCNILDGCVRLDVFIQRIQAAVDHCCDFVRVFNLSANTNVPISGNEMSIIGYELDALQYQKKIQFVVSAGNHELWRSTGSLEEILDDDDSVIAAPADSMLSIVVGAVVGKRHVGSLSVENQIAPYSRRGPGFKGFSKPDLSAYAGTVVHTTGADVVPNDEYSLLLTSDGSPSPDCGTSFSAPIVAGDFAELLKMSPSQDILLAKALLYHNAKLGDDESMSEDELISFHNLFGQGLVNVEDSKYSSSSKVTFLRTGILNRVTKERVSVFMPEILAAQAGRNIARVSVTCVSLPPVDRTKGTEYLGAYIRASLKKSNNDDGSKLLPVSQDYTEGRQKWNPCHHYSKLFSRFNSGDWQVWLELFSRWEGKDVDVPYALVITIEDVSNTLDIYSEIAALNRYQPLSTIRLRLSN